MQDKTKELKNPPKPIALEFDDLEALIAYLNKSQHDFYKRLQLESEEKDTKRGLQIAESLKPLTVFNANLSELNTTIAVFTEKLDHYDEDKKHIEKVLFNEDNPDQAVVTKVKENSDFREETKNKRVNWLQLALYVLTALGLMAAIYFKK